MAFGLSGVLGIEIRTNEIRVVHGSVSGNLLKVYDFAAEEILLSNSENAVQQLESIVERKRLRSYPVALTLSGPGVVHRVLEFPPMPLNELAVVVEREMRLAGTAAEEAVFGWEVIVEKDSSNLKETRVLVAIAPRAQVEGARELLAGCRLKPALFTTPPVALLRSLAFVQEQAGGMRAVLYIDGQRGYLLGVKDGVWNFYREFSSRAAEAGRGAVLEEAVREANRAVLYHRQRYRGAAEMGFLLTGEKDFAELQDRLQRETGVQGEVVRTGPRLDLSPLAERAAIFRDLFPSFLVSIGLIAATYLPAKINLVPKALRMPVSQRPSVNLSFLQGSVLAFIVVPLLVAVHLVLVFTERHYQGVLRDRTNLYAAWLPAIQSAEQTRALRENEQLLAQSIGSGRVGETSWVVLFKAFSRLAPSDMIFQSVNFQRDKDKGVWLVVLKGQVVSPDSYAAQSAFNRFYHQLKISPYFEQLELLPLDISTFSEKAGGQEARPAPVSSPEAPPQTKAAAAEVAKTRIQFELHAQSKGI